MWDIEQIPEFDRLEQPDQLWLIALAVEENGGPPEYVLALRAIAERLAELGWWLGGSAADTDAPDRAGGLPMHTTPAQAAL